MKKKFLVYNTGRPEKNVPHLFNEGLLCPDFIVTSTGSELYCYNEKTEQYELDENWMKIIYEEWDPDQIILEFEKLNYLKKYDQTTRICFLALVEDIEKNQAEILDRKTQFEKKTGLKSQLLIYGRGPKRFVEILSKNAGKGKVIEYLCKINDVKKENTLGFGDSLNDAEIDVGGMMWKSFYGRQFTRWFA